MACCPFLPRRTDLCSTVSWVLFLLHSLGIRNEQGTYFSSKLTFNSAALSLSAWKMEANAPKAGFYRQTLLTSALRERSASFPLDLLMELQTQAHKTAFISPSTAPMACCKGKQTQSPVIKTLGKRFNSISWGDWSSWSSQPIITWSPLLFS